ncbi:MAG: BamA/TamA family outer membrane protein [Holosporales bacterium]|nr:BamA/TamA family outer membrane protein [Holosporales bacterium]
MNPKTFCGLGRVLWVISLSLFLFPYCYCAGADTFERVSSLAKKVCEIELKGFPSAVASEFEQNTTYRKSSKNSVVSGEEVVRLAQKGKEILAKSLTQLGYFDATIEVEIEETGKYRIIYTAVPGARYTVAEKKLEILDSPLKFTRIKNLIRSRKRDFVNFAKIEKEERWLSSTFKRQGFFFAKIDEPMLNINEQAKTASVVYQVSPGEKTSISSIELSGNVDVPESFIVKRSGIKINSILTHLSIERAKRNLQQTGLFSSIKVFATKDQKPPLPKSSPESDEQMQKAVLNIKVSEMPPRLVGAGAYYSASEGALLSTIWQHKNFLHKGHNIGATARISQKELSAMLFYNIQDIFLQGQKLHGDFSMFHFATKAYSGNKASVTMGLSQEFYIGERYIELSFAPTLERGAVSRETSYRQDIGGFLSGLSINLTNHSLYPTKGAAFKLNFDQYYGNFAYIPSPESLLSEKTKSDESAQIPALNTEGARSLTLITGVLTCFLPLSRKTIYEPNSTVLAAFLKVGSANRGIEHIPFDKRFYGGGRSSIRSHGYQMAGELDASGIPVGGASIVEACLEPRIRVSENVGVVAFVDYSCITREKTPTFYKKGYARGGWGVGVRYFTQFGPVRLDIGFPFKRRVGSNGKKLDSALQFFISVGQVF